MTYNLRLWMIVLVLPLMQACEQQTESFIEVNGNTYFSGSDFVILDEPIRLDDRPVANFIEVFWYGCIHCQRFEPLLQDWIPTLPPGLLVGRSPAIWNKSMIEHAYAYYIAQELQLGHEFHMQLFTRVLSLRASKDLAFHRSRITSLFVDQGVSKEQFDLLYDSELIQRKVAFSGSLMKRAGITSTPTFLINGKYVLTGTPFKSTQELLAVARHLLEKELENQPADWW